MLQINRIYSLSRSRYTLAKLSTVALRYRLTSRRMRVLQRFYALESVAQSVLSHQDLLASVIQDATDKCKLGPNGLLIYAKTQTHNTDCGNWLRHLANDFGLESWIVTTLSQNHCASFASSVHMMRNMRFTGPGLLVTGEKSFHPEFNNLGIGVLGELSTAVLFNCSEYGVQWYVVGSHVEHDTEFFRGLDKDRGTAGGIGLRDYTGRLSLFLKNTIESIPISAHAIESVVPINLNIPAFRESLARLGIDPSKIVESSRSHGHLYCSDLPHNLCSVSIPKHSYCLAVAVGIGDTYSSLLLQKGGSLC